MDGSRASLSRTMAARIDASSADANGVSSARKRSALACGARESDARKDSITTLHVGRSSALTQVDTAPVTARAKKFEQAPSRVPEPRGSQVGHNATARISAALSARLTLRSEGQVRRDARGGGGDVHSPGVGGEGGAEGGASASSCSGRSRRVRVTCRASARARV
eukprot:1008868-Pleurochrysis_carterae.AAC.2